jgi:hypothetical protein
MTLNYTFNNMSQLSDDNYSIMTKTKQNKQINTYLTERFNPCSKKALGVALEQPNMFIKGSYGNTGCNVDEFSELRNGSITTNEPCKLSLQERMYSTVPYLGKGVFNSNTESELIHGDFIDRNKSVNTIMDKQFSTQYTPLIPELKKTISNPSNLVEQHADENWIRGGVPTRDAYRNKSDNDNKK